MSRSTVRLDERSLRRLDPSPRRSDDFREPNPRLPLGLRARRFFFTSQGKSDRATAARRRVPIMAYVGPNGGGKTLCAVKDLLPALLAGKPVLANTPLIDTRDAGRAGTSFPSFVKMVHADQMLDFDGGEVLLDEMATVANSRQSASLDPRFDMLFQQLRKNVDRVSWCAPDFSRADVIFRQVTQAVTECRGFYSDRNTGLDQYGLPKAWAPKRLHRWVTYETLDFSEWTAGKRDKAEPEVAEWCYPPSLLHNPHNAYDTLAPVEKVAGITIDGACPYCGKKTRQESCRGHSPEEVQAFELELTATPEHEHAHGYSEEVLSEALTAVLPAVDADPVSEFESIVFGRHRGLPGPEER